MPIAKWRPTRPDSASRKYGRNDRSSPTRPSSGWSRIARGQDDAAVVHHVDRQAAEVGVEVAQVLVDRLDPARARRVVQQSLHLGIELDRRRHVLEPLDHRLGRRGEEIELVRRLAPLRRDALPLAETKRRPGGGDGGQDDRDDDRRAKQEATPRRTARDRCRGVHQPMLPIGSSAGPATRRRPYLTAYSSIGLSFGLSHAVFVAALSGSPTTVLAGGIGCMNHLS